jgi:hypothetical protein
MKIVLRHTNTSGRKDKHSSLINRCDVPATLIVVLTNSKRGLYDETWICGAAWWIIIIQVKRIDQVLSYPSFCIPCLGLFIISVWIFHRVWRDKQGNTIMKQSKSK